MDELFKVPNQFCYNGVNYPSSVKTHLIERINEVQIHPSDILFVGYPRSGNNWVQFTVHLIKHRYALDSAIENYDRIMLEFEGSKVGGVDAAKASINPDRMLLSHLTSNYLEKLIVDQHCKTIVVYRDPRDMLVSLYHFYKDNPLLGSFPGDWNDFFKLYEANALIYGDWTTHMESYLKFQHLPNVLLIKYENLKSNLEQELIKIASFMDVQTTKESLENIIKMLSVSYMKNQKITNGHYSKFYNLIRKGERKWLLDTVFLRRSKSISPSKMWRHYATIGLSYIL